MPHVNNKSRKKVAKKDTRKPNSNSAVFKKFKKIVKEGKG